MSFHISQRFIDELLEEDCPYMDLAVCSWLAGSPAS